MAKWLMNLLERWDTRNATSRATSSRVSSFNRDPKAIQVKRIGYQLGNSSGSGRDNFEAPEADFNLIDQAIKRDSYLMQSVMKYEELIFKSGWSLQGKNEQALQYVKLRLEMMAVATGVPTEELFHGIASDIVRYCNSFIVKVRAKNGRGLPPGLSAIPIPPAKAPVVGYFRLPPHTMQIARDENGNIVKYRQESQGGDPIEFKPEDIIHIKVNVPVGKVFGDPWLAPVLEDVRLLRKIEENVGLLLYRHIFPLLKYKVGLAQPGFEATDEELEELRSIIENMPTDGALVLPERHDVEAVRIDAIDGRPYLDYFENRVFSGLGLSQVDFGRGDTANRSTADAMTGIKADRVKGFQQAIMMQIDKYMIDELLVEGGFDPIVNPEFDINFVFNEIELERKIAKETHEIFKFNNNIQTWEETRVNIGLEPVADESRLHHQMIGGKTSKEAENKNQPTNQHGSRVGPKRSTEQLSIQEHYEHQSDSNDLLIHRIHQVYENMTHDMIQEVNHMIQKQKALSYYPIHEGARQIENLLIYEAQGKFLRGIQKAKEDLKLESSSLVKDQSFCVFIKEQVHESVEQWKKQMIQVIESNKSSVQSIDIKSVFEAMKFKLPRIANSIRMRSYHYGYVLCCLHYGVVKFQVECQEGECSLCRSKAEEMIQYDVSSNIDERLLFYRIPPWHPNCKCRLVASLDS